MGKIYQRRKSGVWWIQYQHNGKQIRKSTKHKVKAVAERMLKQIEGHIAEGRIPGTHFGKTIFAELKENFIRDYEINRRKTLANAKSICKGLEKHFGGLRAREIDTLLINEYIEARLKEGVSNATVNRGLEALQRMLNLGIEAGKVERLPHIAFLKEAPPREGFLEHWEFLLLRDALPDYLKGFVTFAYRTGWRKSEIAGLRWKQVDRLNGVVRLAADQTKNESARTLYLDGELKDVIEHQKQIQRGADINSEYVFTVKAGSARIREIRKTWKRACDDAGLGKRLFHDFRRTAIRNMVRAGIQERVAMQISGHKTRAVFDRYNIVNDADLRAAAERQAEFLSNQEPESRTKVGQIADIHKRKAAQDCS